MWPGEGSPYRGVFVQRQVDSLRDRRPDCQFDVFTIAGSRGRWDYLRAVPRLRRSLATGYDIVHAHYGLTAASVALTGTRVPLVVTLHGDDVNIGWQRAITRVGARRADRVIAVSPSIAARVRDLNPIVLPCGVAPRDFAVDRALARARAGIGADELLVVFPGDPSVPVKDYGLFRATIAALSDELRARVVTRELRGVVPKDVPWLFGAADAVLLTSRSEGSPMVVKEALAAGVPIVAVPVGDVAQVIADVPDCRLATRDPHALANALTRTLTHPSGAPGDRRLRLAELGLDAGTIAARLLAIYDELANDRERDAMAPTFSPR